MNQYYFQTKTFVDTDKYKENFKEISYSKNLLKIKDDKSLEKVIDILDDKSFTQLFDFTYTITNLTCSVCASKIKDQLEKNFIYVSLSLVSNKLTVLSEKDQTSLIQKIIDSIEDDVSISLDKKNKTYTYCIQGLNCPVCASKIKDKLSEKYDNVDINLIDKKLSVDSLNNEINNIQDVINFFEDGVSIKEIKDTKEEKKIPFYKKLFLDTDYFTLLASFVLSLVSYITLKNTVYLAPIIILIYLLLSYNLIITCFKEIFKKHILGEHSLMAIASIGALFLANFFEAIAVVWLFKLGEIIENHALSKAKEELNDFDKMVENTCKVVLDNNDVIVKNTNDVELNENVIFTSGQVVSFDGVVINGSATTDESSLTGESKIIYKNINDKILAGSLVTSGQIIVKVETKACDSTLTKIINRLKESQGQENKNSKLITKFAKYYTPIVVSLAFLYTLISILINPGNYSNYIYNGLIFLVISCPCALVISIPLAYFSSLSNCARKAILFKNSSDLDTLAKIKNICFDKTGTLTYASAKISKIEFSSDLDLDKDYVLQLIKSCEISSNHPIANAIKELNVQKLYKVSKSDEKPSMGLVCTCDNHEVKIGNSKLVKTKVKADVHVEIDNKYVASIFIDEKIKDSSFKAIKMLKNYDLSIVSGDCQDRCEKVGKSLGIKNIYGNCSAFDKEKIISNKNCIFIGDGLNDALSMKKAKLGVAMGNIGNDITISEANMVIGDDSLLSLAKAIKLSKKTKRIIIFNISFILGIKTLVMILAAFGLTPMFIAIASDVGLSVLTSLNSFRLLNSK